MGTEFNILWSRESKIRFDDIAQYLRDNWSEKEVKKFISQIRTFERIVVKFPEIYAESNKRIGLRQAIYQSTTRCYMKLTGKTLLLEFTPSLIQDNILVG